MFATSIDPEFYEREIERMRRIVTLREPEEIARLLPTLATGEFLALRLPQWRSKSECNADIVAFEKLIVGTYSQEPTLAKGGPAVYDYEGREAESSQYFAEAKVWNSTLRKALYPRYTAQDHLTAILGETYAPGVVPEKLLTGMVPSLQVIRKYEVGARAGPHVDRTDWDWPLNMCAASQTALFSALVYHQVADIGGELVLYGDSPDRAAWLAAKLPDSAYEINRKFLNRNPTVIAPKVGDLIIFDARRVHEVRKIVMGMRVTSSCFFAWRGGEQPLGRYA